jgi:hypothetical protein
MEQSKWGCVPEGVLRTARSNVKVTPKRVISSITNFELSKVKTCDAEESSTRTVPSGTLSLSLRPLRVGVATWPRRPHVRDTIVVTAVRTLVRVVGWFRPASLCAKDCSFPIRRGVRGSDASPDDGA